MDNVEWTSSFWTGMLWLAYEITGDVKYCNVAEIQLESYKKRVDEKIASGTHDLGFLYTLSSVAAYKLTKSEEAKGIAVKAADLLMGQYFEKAKIIQAWGGLDDPENGGRMIIDCCMNLPLLYWASEVTGDSKYYQAAYSHVKQAEKYIIREEASSYHTYFMGIYTPAYGCRIVLSLAGYPLSRKCLCLQTWKGIRSLTALKEFPSPLIQKAAELHEVLAPDCSNYISPYISAIPGNFTASSSCPAGPSALIFCLHFLQ
ncbi:hypothetical protein J2T17_002415 [Paenibacillus mucilaginosus]|uniref:glycoside hydrolase family 88 protein n=1 Tax=Paenibacillus mucilaginosus TaxID=61624 RepID=UPI003D20900F